MEHGEGVEGARIGCEPYVSSYYLDYVMTVCDAGMGVVSTLDSRVLQSPATLFVYLINMHRTLSLYGS